MMGLSRWCGSVIRMPLLVSAIARSRNRRVASAAMARALSSRARRYSAWSRPDVQRRKPSSGSTINAPARARFCRTVRMGYGDFTGLHWGVLVRMDRSDILAPIRTVLQNLALAGALIVLPLLGSHLWTSGRLQAEYLRAREESARAMAAEATLRLRDRAIAETSNGILITDPHQRDNPIIYVNPAFERITGYRMNEVLGRNCRFIQGSDTDPATVAVMRQAIAEQRDCQVIIRNYRKDGAPFWNELTISPVHDGRGQVTHFVGVLADITARKGAEDAIERLSRQNELILNAAGEGIFGLDLQGKTTFVNPAAARMVGWSVAELIGQPMHLIMHHTKPDGIPYPEEECPIQAAFKKDAVVHRVADDVFWRR